MPSASREIVVSNKLGLHARPAMQFVDLASQFGSAVTVYKGGDEPEQADGKSDQTQPKYLFPRVRIRAKGDTTKAALAEFHASGPR
jgi:phosphotransferase system HPr-like phosphotransfer protein